MKKFVALSLVLMMALALCACGNKVEAQTWKFACSATDNTCWADMGRDFGKMISEATDGAITVQVYAADQLTSGNQTEGIQGVIDGTIDLSAHSNIIYANFDQRLNVVSMPFLFDSYEDVDAKLTGEAGAAVGKVVEEQGLKIRVAGCKVLNTAYDLWGTNWTNANWSEVYTGLQTGTYEGQENPFPTADGASMSEVQTHVTNWTGVYDCIFFTMNKELFDSLSPELQKTVLECGAKAAENQRKLQREGVNEVIEKWKDAGVTVTELSDEAVAEFKAATASMYTDPEIVELLTADLIAAFTK